MSGLYIHIPFCRHKCLYCDFYTGGERIADWPAYTDCLLKEIQERKIELEGRLCTLYIGGGTPSLIPADEFIRLIEGIKSQFEIKEFEEFTIEVNPEDVTEDKIKMWKESGVNRISIGVQTLNDNELKAIGRFHTSGQALGALEKLQKHFDNISIDLIYGLPGQTPETYKDTLEKIMKYRPEHISVYALMLEEGTAMTLLESQGKISLPDEKDWISMSDLTLKYLSESGYMRYEISNYSLEGKESIHNTFYWNGIPYLGIGPGAHSYDGNKVRRWNPNDIKGYFKYWGSDTKITKEGRFYLEEILNEDELREEMIMTRLRTAKGLSLIEYEKRFGKTSKNKLLEEGKRFINSGCLIKEKDYIRFSDRGFIISNIILSSLI